MESERLPPNWKSPEMSLMSRTSYSPEFNKAMRTGLIVQAILAAGTALMLDFGQSHRAFWVAMICQWATVFIILLRRSNQPAKFDLVVIRYGIFPFFFFISYFGPRMLDLLGIAKG